ncbi:hypothetical protein ACS0TY_014109 [Phlomoides rotata]
METRPPEEEKKKPRPKDVFGRALPTEEQFEVLKNAPRFDCGMLTVKYIEFLLAGKDVSVVRPNYMRELRKKLAVYIFSQSFDL